MRVKSSVFRGWRLGRYAALGLVSAVITFGFWSALPASYQANESTDFRNFHDPVARNLLAGRGLVTPDGNPAVRFTPGFSMMLCALYLVCGSERNQC